MVILELPNLRDTIARKDSTYEVDKHYIEFLLASSNLKLTSTGRYLTYRGLVKVIMHSKSKCASKFEDWMLNIIYAAHLGSVTQREVAAASILHKSVKELQKALSKHAISFPCIYLLKFGKVKDLIKIDVRVDELNKKEMMVFPVRDQLAQFKKSYEVIGSKYAGSSNQLQVLIEKMKLDHGAELKEIESEHFVETLKMTHAAELKDLRHVLELKDMALTAKEKDLEIASLKLKLAELDLRERSK